MNERKLSRKVLFILIVLAVAAVPLLVAGVGWAQEGDQGLGNQDRSGPQTEADLVITDPDADVPAIIAEITGGGDGSTIVPAAAFIDDGFGDQSYGLTFAWGAIWPTTTSGFCMQAPVYLPNGATVTAFGGHLYDNNANGDFWRVELRRVSYKTLNGSTTMADAPSSGAANAYKLTLDTTIANAVVDNANYAYFAAVCASGSDSSTRLYAVQVFHTQ